MHKPCNQLERSYTRIKCLRVQQGTRENIIRNSSKIPRRPRLTGRPVQTARDRPQPKRDEGKFDVIRAIRIDQTVGEAGPQPNLVFLPTSWLSRRSFKLETSRPSIGSKETRRENNLTSLPISIDSVVNNPVDRAKFFQGISVVLSHVSTTNARNFVLVRVELVY